MLTFSFIVFIFSIIILVGCSAERAHSSSMMIVQQLLAPTTLYSMMMMMIIIIIMSRNAQPTSTGTRRLFYQRVSMHTRDAPMQYLAKVYRIIARNTTMVFNIAKIAPLYRKVRAAVANGSTPKTDQMAAKLLECVR